MALSLAVPAVVESLFPPRFPLRYRREIATNVTIRLLQLDDDSMGDLEMVCDWLGRATYRRPCQNALIKWALESIEDRYWTLEEMFAKAGGRLPVWRVITAPADWKPGGRHPGKHWSFRERAAEAHWAGSGPGFVHWRMAAHVTPDVVDWYWTLGIQAYPFICEEECEIRVLDDIPMSVDSFERIPSPKVISSM